MDRTVLRSTAAALLLRPVVPPSVWQFRSVFRLTAVVLLLLTVCHLLARRIHPERERVMQIPLKDLDHVSHRKRREAARHIYATYLPRAKALEWMSVGNTNVAADWVLLKSMAYTSREVRRGGEKMDWLEKMYNVLLDLDPEWQNMYLLSATMLSLVNRKAEASLRVLERAMKKWPHTYRYPWEAGLVCMFSPHMMLKEHAKDYFQLAADDDKTDCPPLVKQFVALYLKDEGRYEVACRIAADRFRNVAAGSPARKPALHDLVECRSLLLLSRLRGEIDFYKKRTGRDPERLEAIAPRVAGWARRGPGWASDLKQFQARQDYYGLPLRYDADTPKKVYSEALLIWLTHRHMRTINQMLGIQENESQRTYATIGELVADLRKDYAGGLAFDDIFLQLFAPGIPNPKPSDLKVPNYPFGFKLTIDPDTKRVVLPPDRTFRRVDQAVAKLLK